MKLIKDVQVTVENEAISDLEIEKYIEYIEDKNKCKVKKLKLCFDGDYVDMTYSLTAKPFERIRRITGYLVGNLSQWNDAKRTEEHDRVKHSTQMEVLD